MQIFAYEHDTTRLLQEIQLYVAAGKALYGALFLCRYSGQPSAIEKRSITAASSNPGSPLGRGSSVDTQSATRRDLRGDLTLTLIHVDTTWRFDDSPSRLASPKLSWPEIRAFYTPGAFVDADLVLIDQHFASPRSFVPPSKMNT